MQENKKVMSSRKKKKKKKKVKTLTFTQFYYLFFPCKKSKNQFSSGSEFSQLGLSNPPSHPLVPDWCSPYPTAPAIGRGSQAPKPDVGGSVSSPLVQNLWNPTRLKTLNSGEFSSDSDEFSAWFGRFWRPKQSNLA